ncbi:phenazine biosynthesis PhzC/PhzF protein [Acetobacter nitrogenifigens DSM 23921 = NBRC 105050]|uniref:Phenazine biosynthesis protein PhzF n=1 Tax=Acetobacter nitrogenifigens DSM 23921 = NBRC 105050 TaxID=1120919 RepID=A0A511XB19_9PROT|nr:PhzF family phenazine biosynthesis protein [Acetobacter nitrogenifigens]GBQ88210.1 phenazine biosynthesis PhzC/PhzF protein [Acetobacter nitrogenifigens DSM 23921 = NBRC 105050]GEN60115.1 phenazine biosynthesis protein PhzF [Acetobacter nitrogenifigens DSM 23921 = NBRC 105050]
MTTELPFLQVDVFAAEAFRGNPLAVVAGADALSTDQMAQIANWTNLSETTFILKPEDPKADYRVRIFTPHGELPFAGHPTLGTAYVWRTLGGHPKSDAIMQECGVGLVPVRERDGRYSFAAPPRRRSGPADEATIARAAAAVRLNVEDVISAEWADNGPGWLALRLRSREAVLTARPDWNAFDGLKLGLVGAWDPAQDGDAAQFEIRALYSEGDGRGFEDPVTGSLNAAIAQWLIDGGFAPSQYIASQGAALGRIGRVFVEREKDDIWIGGDVVTRIEGTITP